VGEAEFKECLAKYRKAVHLYSKILDNLKAAREAAEGVPILRRAHRRIDEAVDDIVALGDLISLVPELTNRLRALGAQMRLAALMREDPFDVRFLLPFDIKASEGEPDETTDEGKSG